MRSLSLVRMPCFRRCSMISTTSPNHEGVEGTECEEVWMMTEESAILVMCTSLLGKMCILPQERHILCLLATNYISLRNSWAGPGKLFPPDLIELLLETQCAGLLAGFLAPIPLSQRPIPHKSCGPCGFRKVGGLLRHGMEPDLVCLDHP